MNDIFISYSRYDSNKVNELVTLLEQEGYSIWIDRDGIESGDDFKRVILKSIKESKVILFFSSEHSNSSDWTAKEIGVAVKYKKHIIPIKLDNSNYNEAVEFDLINLDYIDYSKPLIQTVMREKLLNTLRKKLGLGSKEIERLEAERKAKEVEERARLEKERLERAEAERKAKEAIERERLERERAETQRKTELEKVNQLKVLDNLQLKQKRNLWIGVGAVVVVFLVLLLAWSKKSEPVIDDQEEKAYQACRTITDYRSYLSDYGSEALHYADANAFIEQYLADSTAKAQQEFAELQAQQEAEAELTSKAEEKKKEDDAYKKCTTIVACNNYLKAYPKGRYVTEVKNKKAELEAEVKAQAEAEIKENEAYTNCTTVEACDNYLAAYSQGRYVAEVQKKKAELENKIPKNGFHNDHEYVDLGLPSGTLWATCNVGASKPEGYGNYYAWGEIITKDTYDWETYKYANGKSGKLTKYCNKSDMGKNGFTDNLTALQSGDDPVTTTWGSGWQAPSKAQWDELLSNTTTTWTNRNLVYGVLLTSKKNGQAIFLPSTGLCLQNKLHLPGSGGCYWSRSLYTVDPSMAWNLTFGSEEGGCGMNKSSRVIGFTVRPVREK